MKKTLISSLFFISFLYMYAQDNFRQAYIITLTNDTVHGQIDLRTDKLNALSCRFRIAPDSDIGVYYPGDITAYRFVEEGKYYISKEVFIDNDSAKLFLEFMVQGVMNLYYYRASDEQSYFFFENDTGEMLTVTQLPSTVDDQNKIHVDNKYKGVLRYAFREYEPIANNADNIRYDKKSMIKVTKTYHDNVCTTGEECIIYENKNPDKVGARFVFSLYSGVQYATYTFLYYYGFYALVFKEYSPRNFAPLLGGQVNLFVPSFSRSFSLQLDFSASYLYTDNTALTQSMKVSYNTVTLSPKVGVKYRYPKFKWRPVAEAGYAFTGLLNPNYTESHGRIDRNTNEFKVTSTYERMMRNYFHGFYAGVGVDYNIRKEQAVFLRLLYEGCFDDFRTWEKDDRLSSFQLKLGYSF